MQSNTKHAHALSQSPTLSRASLPQGTSQKQTGTFNINCPLESSSCVPKVNLTDLHLGKEIGRGAFSVVFEGDWLKTKVAVKEICVKRIKFMKSFIVRELALHSQLRHPNIVLPLAYAIQNSRLYLVTELIDGDTLDNILFGEKREPMNMQERLNISVKVSQAVAYLHN